MNLLMAISVIPQLIYLKKLRLEDDSSSSSESDEKEATPSVVN